MEKFRELKQEDEAHVLELMRQLTKAEINFDIQTAIADDKCHCLVVEYENRVIGFGALIVHLVPVRGYVGKIEDIVIHEEFRGKGLGRKLMQELLSIGKKKNLKLIDLTSNPSRIPARKLYESLGFELRDTGVFRLSL